MYESTNSNSLLTPAENPSLNGARRCSLVGSDGAAGSYIVRRMGFTKLDEGILQSSIMHEDGNTFKVWIILLAACKEDGIARVSPIFISSISAINIDTVDKCLEKLSSPDKHSRSINNDGRRIERIDGGYRIINYQKYRNYTYSGTKEAAKKRKQRERKINELERIGGTNKGHVPIGGGHSASASASASDINSGKESERNQNYEAFKKAYPQNGSVMNPEVLNWFILRTDENCNGFEKLIKAAGEYATFWKETEPDTYPNCKMMKQAIKWLREAQYEIDWTAKLAAEKKYQEKGKRHGINSPNNEKRVVGTKYYDAGFR